MEITYTVGELKRMLEESSTKNEFKPVMGDKVESDDKKNNEKAYKDAKKRAKDFDGGLEETPKQSDLPDKLDGNKTTLDYNMENITPELKEKFKAQAEGYTSTLEKDNDIEKSEANGYSDKTYKQIKKAGETMQKNIEDFKKSGLQARALPAEWYEKENMYKENRNIKVISFKQTKFLTEGHMLSRIPDEFKKEGQIFRMKDNAGNDYLVEWSENKGNVLNYQNKILAEQELNRIKNLSGYRSSDYYVNTNVETRVNESNEAFKNTLDAMRKILK